MKKLLSWIFALQFLVAEEIKIDLIKFNSIENKSPIKIVLYSSDKYFASVDGADDIFNKLQIKTINGVLNISQKNKSWWRFWDKILLGSIDLNIFLPLDELKSIHNYGIGSIQSIDQIKTQTLSIHQTGTGKIMIGSLSSNDLELKLNGTGKINFQKESSINSAQISLNGTGSIDMGESLIKSANVKISGTGDIKLNVEDLLDGRTNGAGNIYYSGNPQISFKSNGVGAIIPYK